MSKKLDSIEFQIRAIELLDYSLIPPNEKLEDSTLFHFDVKIEHKLKVENDLFFVVTQINIYTDDETKPIGHLKSSCIFSIKDLSKFIDKKTGSLNFNDEILTTFNSVSISTTRGLMFSQFRGTVLHSAILPIVDPSTFTSKVK